MDPRTLIPDIYHLDKTSVQSRFFQGLLKKGFVRSRGACRNNNTVQFFIDNRLFNQDLSILRTCIEIVRAHYHIRKGGRVFPDLCHVHYTPDILAAVADKDTDPQGLVRNRTLFGKRLFLDACAPRRCEKLGSARSSAACLHNAIRQGHRPPDSTGRIYPPFPGQKRRKEPCPAKSILIQINTRGPCKREVSLWSLQAHWKHNKVKDLLLQGAVFSNVSYGQILSGRIRLDLRDP